MVFNTTPLNERQGYMLEVLGLMNQCRERLKKKFDVILELLEGGEYHNSRKMKIKKRSLEDFLSSFGNYSTLFLEWKELMKKDMMKEKNRK